MIVLRADDLPILQLIKNTLDCGKINHVAQGKEVRLSVQNTKDNYEKIVPFFMKHKIRGKKGLDFQLWANAVKILYKHKSHDLNIKKGVRGFTTHKMTREDEHILNKIRNEMLNFKSKRDSFFKWGN